MHLKQSCPILTEYLIPSSAEELYWTCKFCDQIIDRSALLKPRPKGALPSFLGVSNFPPADARSHQRVSLGHSRAL